MEKWQPIDVLEELAVEPDPAGGVSANHEISSLQRTRKLSQGCSSLLWMFVTAVCLMLLLCVTKRTFADLGKKPFLLANIVMAVVIFAVSGYGVFMWVKNRSFITQLPRRIQLRGVLGLAGLLVCLVITLVLAGLWRGEDAVKQEKRIILQAQEVFNVLAIGDVHKSYFVVEWKKLKVNGVDFGSRFRAAPGPEEEKQIIEEVFNRFEDMGPGSLKHWYVEKRALDETVVSVRIPKLEKKILFTIQGGMLVGLDIKSP